MYISLTLKVSETFSGTLEGRKYVAGIAGARSLFLQQREEAKGELKA